MVQIFMRGVSVQGVVVQVQVLWRERRVCCLCVGRAWGIEKLAGVMRWGLRRYWRGEKVAVKVSRSEENAQSCVK